MNAALRVLEKFGGQSAVARIIGKGQSTVQYWVKVGMIPVRWHATLLAEARERGVDLTAGDFVSAPEPTEGDTKLPEAKWFGHLQLGDAELPCYVLEDGRRVISRTGATSVLAGKKGGGQLEKYISAGALKEYMPTDLPDQMIDFCIPEVVNKTVKGIEAETFVEICRGYVRALADEAEREASQLLTDEADRETSQLTKSQQEMAWKASAFLASCAKVGLIALIDEATGYQYDRAQDALRVKLRAYLEEEMRKWEKTFPDELWLEFGRLTNWKGAVTQRPKYWGKLVMELIYEYLDPDVAKWLRENAPKPRHGKNYHLWLTSQYGLKKLLEHIWMVIGMARACKTMRELREKMAQSFGRHPIQVTVFVPPAGPGQRLLPFMGEGATNEPGKNGAAEELE